MKSIVFFYDEWMCFDVQKVAISHNIWSFEGKRVQRHFPSFSRLKEYSLVKAAAEILLATFIFYFLFVVPFTWMLSKMTWLKEDRIGDRFDWGEIVIGEQSPTSQRPQAESH